jgi:hypothetical protein
LLEKRVGLKLQEQKCSYSSRPIRGVYVSKPVLVVIAIKKEVSIMPPAQAKDLDGCIARLSAEVKSFIEWCFKQGGSLPTLQRVVQHLRGIPDARSLVIGGHTEGDGAFVVVRLAAGTERKLSDQLLPMEQSRNEQDV